MNKTIVTMILKIIMILIMIMVVMINISVTYLYANYSNPDGRVLKKKESHSSPCS